MQYEHLANFLNIEPCVKHSNRWAL